MSVALKTSPVKRCSSPSGGVRRRSGFTLVEMLISVALVLLMMTLFAQVFQMAGNSISKQRGLAENDQRSRMLQTMIKADLDNRSFVTVMPFAPGETLTEAYKRDGYFYISDNNTANGIDDVLQFTVQLKNGADPYYGKALTFPATDSSSPPNPDFTAYPFGVFQNQPDFDDSQAVPNNTGSSMLAEVSYFVRNGNLYRRQLLIRQPAAVAGAATQPDTSNGSDSPTNPPKNLFSLTTAPGYPYLLGYTMSSGKPYATSFWNDFDYSAYYSGATGCAAFSGRTSMQNDGTSYGALANPQLRFGHDSTSGLPKEFLTYSGTPTGFIGRYTLEECSNSAFQYPQSTALNPMAFAFPGTTGTYDLGNDGVVTGLKGGLRRGEDLLIANVHAFDIQILDEAAGQFVNPTASNSSDYSVTNQLNTAYGPYGTSGTTNAVFDTWHPKIDWNADTVWDSPPFFPQKNIPGGASSTATFWTPNKTYSIGDKVFPSTTLKIAPYFYQLVQTTTGANSGLSNNTTDPTWPLKAGAKVMDNGILIWQAVDNRKPLKAFKIEIRFLDVSTQQMRQMTMIHSLVD